MKAKYLMALKQCLAKIDTTKVGVDHIKLYGNGKLGGFFNSIYFIL